MAPNPPATFILWLSQVLLTLSIAGHILFRRITARRQVLGMLLRAALHPTAGRWLGAIGTGLGMVLGREVASAGPRYWALAVITLSCWLCLCGLVTGFLPASLFVHEGGIAAGLRMIPWAELSG